ncbi:hypothetical protein BDA96_06G102000 [Sorghum bicolor]|uniref:MLO-like protein n=1 Tax=Sorghum bicolor TaxID=4558 RepID=A0A921QQI7_SORBI|nr:hypothetical protein BDA96_06G102000 [Sorghum bicolor]
MPEPEETSLEGTPTWIVASVCSLMLLRFVSLLLVVFQDVIQDICIDESLMERWLPCRGASSAAAHHHRSIFSILGRDGAGSTRRRTRMLQGRPAAEHCSNKGQVPLLSLPSLEQIHVFIFLRHDFFLLSAITVLLGLLQMRKWMHWENAIQEEGDSARKVIIRVQKIKFIQDWCKGHEKRSFFKQFYGSLTQDDYDAMRLGFVLEHISGHPKFNFYDYMIKALEKDFKRVVGIKTFVSEWEFNNLICSTADGIINWIFVMIFLLLNVNGWHSNFWISLIPLSLLLLIGAKLEHIINKMAYEVATKHTAASAAAAEDEEGGNGVPMDGMVMSPSDDLFWFRSPRLVLSLIHFILFQNAFEFAFFFWTLATFGVNSCMMDGLEYSVSRIVTCVIVEVLCNYSTLPLYAIVTHMGSSFKSAVFADDVAEHIRG